MKISKLLAGIGFMVFSLSISAQTTTDMEKYYTPYMLDYLPAGSPG